MQNKIKLIALAGLGTACHQGVKQAEVPLPPNIIFIMSDDHGWQALSAYNGPLAGKAPTPNIDRIAE